MVEMLMKGLTAPLKLGEVIPLSFSTVAFVFPGVLAVLVGVVAAGEFAAAE